MGEDDVLKMKDVLSKADLERYESEGYCYVRGAFSEQVAASCRELIWDEIESQHNQIKRNQKETYQKIPKLRIGIPKFFRGDPFDRVWTPRLMNSLKQVCGPSVNLRNDGLGWWTIAFPNAQHGHWHLDGQIHCLRHPEIHAVLFFLFSNIQDQGGGTSLAIGSHLVARQQLSKQNPMTSSSLTSHLASHNFLIHSITGIAGDVVIAHPLLLHARSPNLSATVRFLCHPAIKDDTKKEKAEVNDELEAALGFSRFRSSKRRARKRHCVDRNTPPSPFLGDDGECE